MHHLQYDRLVQLLLECANLYKTNSSVQQVFSNPLEMNIILNVKNYLCMIQY